MPCVKRCGSALNKGVEDVPAAQSKQIGEIDRVAAGIAEPTGDANGVFLGKEAP